jgi:hypothetical protein
MKAASVLKVTKVDYNKDGKDKTIFVNECLSNTQEIETFTTQSEEFKAGDNVFLVVVNGYNRAYRQDAITKENVVAVKSFEQTWKEMWV